MARPPLELTESQKAEVETLAAVLNAGQIADYFGIGRTTFFAMIGRDPAIAERYKKGKARAIGAVAQSLITKARGGDTIAMIFFLKTQAGWRETLQVATVEPWQESFSDPRTLSDAELAAMIRGSHQSFEDAAIEAPDLMRPVIAALERAPSEQ